MSYTLVYLEDWIGLYNPDGDLISEDHSIDEDEMLRLLGIKFETINGHMDEAVREYVEEKGMLPAKLSELPRSAKTEAP